MSISEICQIVVSLGFLATATVLCLHSRFLYWIGKDLSDSCGKISKALERINAFSPPTRSRGSGYCRNRSGLFG